ncbi:MAG TPA: pitrilysin family protein [Brumimicrobium sp.]|nr:pitrilysin family protein [Brumimicrobium sp.]
MVEFDRFELDNGLRVLFHKDITTPMAVVNTLFDVGARDESPERTGFAHLFEHLMFGGSINIPNFDGPLQEAGGSNNAFTSNDITNYYDVVPVQNLETALWLESDRMLSLAFTEKSLEVQRSVVIEEFKQRYLNQPYGDLWLEFRPLAYQVHPYRWATIGKNIEHIQEATMEEVKGFFKTHYHPGNAILCIAGNLDLDEVKRLVTKWYGDIPAQEKKVRNLPQEPKQTEFRTKTIERDVPSDVYTYGFKMVGKGQKGYYEADLISDILGRGKSSRLYKRLKKELELVTEINAYVMGSIDPGMLMLSIHPSNGVTLEQIDTEIWNIIEELKSTLVEKPELEKIINKVKTTKAFSEQGVLNKSMALAMNELMGDANFINTETDEYEKVTVESIQEQAKEILQKTNCSQLIIKAKKNDE